MLICLILNLKSHPDRSVAAGGCQCVKTLVHLFSSLDSFFNFFSYQCSLPQQLGLARLKLSPPLAKLWCLRSVGPTVAWGGWAAVALHKAMLWGCSLALFYLELCAVACSPLVLVWPWVEPFQDANGAVNIATSNLMGFHSSLKQYKHFLKCIVLRQFCLCKLGCSELRQNLFP